MAEVIQSLKINRASAMTHTIELLTPVTPGNCLAFLFDTSDTLASVDAVGSADVPELEDTAPDFSGFGNNGFAYVIRSASSGLTGMELAFPGEQPVSGVLIELRESDGLSGPIFVRTPVFSAAGTRVSVTPEDDDSIGVSFVYTSSGGDFFIPDAGNTEIDGEMDDTVAASAYSDPLGVAGVKTIGGVMNTAAFCYGIGVTFRNATGGPSFNPAWALGANQVIVSRE